MEYTKFTIMIPWPRLKTRRNNLWVLIIEHRNGTAVFTSPVVWMSFWSLSRMIWIMLRNIRTHSPRKSQIINPHSSLCFVFLPVKDLAYSSTSYAEAHRYPVPAFLSTLLVIPYPILCYRYRSAHNHLNPRLDVHLNGATSLSLSTCSYFWNVK